MHDAEGVWLARAIGAAVGSSISLAYILPETRREAGIRFAVGALCGLTFGGGTGLKIATMLGTEPALSPFEAMLIGSALASLCAWWALGFVMRFFNRSELPFKFRERTRK